MRTFGQIRRLAPALLAALVLCVSVASAGHAHGAAHACGPRIAADVPRAGLSGAADLDCALCAAAARLAAGAVSAPVPAVDGSPQGLAGLERREAVPRAASLSRAESRAPPRLA